MARAQEGGKRGGLNRCPTASKTVLDEDYLGTPVPKNQVDVLMSLPGDTLPTQCTCVAILHASGDDDTTDEGDILDKYREEAGKLGASRVFVQTMEDAGTAERVVDAFFGTGSDRDSDALALCCQTP